MMTTSGGRFVVLVAVCGALGGCHADSHPEVSTLGAREWRSGIEGGADVSFAVDRVEMDSESTRFYVTVTNFSQAPFELTGLCELFTEHQPGTKSLHVTSISGIRAPIEVGESATGVIVFPPIRKTSALALTVFVSTSDPEVGTNVVFLSWP